MSVCACEYDYDEPEPGGGYMRGPHIARKAGHQCNACKGEVQPGQPCVDVRWGWWSGGGFFHRYHAICWELTQRFKDALCDDIGMAEGGWWSGTFDLGEASEHAMANGDDPFWRDWLLMYEMTWRQEEGEG